MCPLLIRYKSTKYRDAFLVRGDAAWVSEKTHQEENSVMKYAGRFSGLIGVKNEEEGALALDALSFYSD